MKILILGGDGYLGWPSAMYFSKKGYEVAIADSFIKRSWELRVGAKPLFKLPTLHERVKIWESLTGKRIEMYIGCLTHPRFVHKVLKNFKPDTIIHYGEQPSAPFSMIGNEKAVETQVNNIAGTINLLFGMKAICPDAHLIKLGTMGEYGTPNIDIEEGYIRIEHNGRSDTVLFPKRPGSFYHLSKVHDTNNLYFACNNWGLKATDLNQGVVYGIETEETKMHSKLNTSFHYDEVFGTVLNRFCTQIVSGLPITPYGRGNQKRGILNILDTLQCVEIAANNPAKPGELAIYNQFTEVFSISELANIVKKSAEKLGIKGKIEHVDNPRIEAEEHYYNPKNNKLIGLGLKPNILSDVLVDSMLKKIIREKENINIESIIPKVQWQTK